MRFICAVVIAASIVANGDTSYSQQNRPDMKREVLPRPGFRPELCEYIQKFVNGVANVYNTYDVGYERVSRAKAYHNTFNNAVKEFAATKSNQEHEWVIEVCGYVMDWSSCLMTISSYERDNIKGDRMRMARNKEAELWKDVCRMCKNTTKKPDIRMLHEKPAKNDIPIDRQIPDRK